MSNNQNKEDLRKQLRYSELDKILEMLNKRYEELKEDKTKIFTIGHGDRMTYEELNNQGDKHE